MFPSLFVSATAIICSMSFLPILPSNILYTCSDLRNPSLFWSKVLENHINHSMNNIMFIRYLKASTSMSGCRFSVSCLLIILRNSLNSMLQWTWSSVTALTMPTTFLSATPEHFWDAVASLALVPVSNQQVERLTGSQVYNVWVRGAFLPLVIGIWPCLNWRRVFCIQSFFL